MSIYLISYSAGSKKAQTHSAMRRLISHDLQVKTYESLKVAVASTRLGYRAYLLVNIISTRGAFVHSALRLFAVVGVQRPDVERF